jgi:tetratricopeptide (TPR) repeat protein
MKKHTPYFTLLLVLIAFASAQAQMPALQKAREHWLGNNDEKALLLYQQVIKEYPTNSPALLEAYYKSGVIYASKKENKKAVIFFQKMIQLKPNKQEKESVLLRSFMQAAANPYQQYMHLAYEYLANIALQQKKYTQALAYYKMAEKKYPSYDQNTDFTRLYTAENYANCYAGLRQADSVLYRLVPFILSSEEYASEGLESLKKNLKEIIAAGELKKACEKALKNVSIQEQMHQEKYVYKVYVQLMGKPLFLYEQTHANPLLPFQQKQAVKKCRKELDFIFKELTREGID